MTTLDTTLLKCRITKWTVQPINVDEPFELGGKVYAWWDCPACDWDENPRNDPAFNPAHPGPHLLSLTPSTPPREWQSRMEVPA